MCNQLLLYAESLTVCYMVGGAFLGFSYWDLLFYCCFGQKVCLRNEHEI